MNILIANSNPLHHEVVKSLVAEYDAWSVSTPTELSEECSKREFDYIIFPHWSFIIPATIYEKFECVLFHMTDLPYGRGGSPLQNLIVRGHTKTKLTAIRVAKGLDTGPVYLKMDLSLEGTARDIFGRVGSLLLEMIHFILRDRPEPVPQKGEPTPFKRRKPKDGNLEDLQGLKNAHDYIRMLDADGYPPAFVETEFLRFEFTRSALHTDKIIADVRITEK